MNNLFIKKLANAYLADQRAAEALKLFEESGMQEQADTLKQRPDD